MTPNNMILALLGLSLLGMSGSAQQNATPGRVDSAAGQFKSLTRQLRIESDSDAKRYTPELRDRLTAQMEHLLAQEVIEALSRDRGDGGTVREKLRDLDSVPATSSEYSNAPHVFQTLIHGTPTVITGFLLLRGGQGAPESKVIIQAYRRSSAGWQLVAETGDDLDRHGLFMVDLPSPRAGESWFLAYGEQLGGNGKMVRVRIYSFDGEKFATVWALPDRLDGEISVAHGIISIRSIDQERYYRVLQPPYTRIERFALTLEGVAQLSSTLGNE